MSIRKWQEIANQKEEVENQRKIILNTFKAKKVADEMGNLAAEKLFRPITKRLTPAEKPEEEEAREDFYGNLAVDPFLDQHIGEEMAGLFDDGQVLLPQNEGVAPKFVRNIPLPDEDDLEEEAILPEQSVLPESDEEVLPGEKPTRWSSAPDLPSYSEVFPRRKKKETESVYLSTLEKFLKKKDPKAVLTISDSQLSHAEAEKAAYEIYSSRAKQVLQGINIGKKKLGPFTGKSHKEIRQMLEKEMTGKGAKQAEGFESLIPRLSLGISSIFAGNSSVKLREEMEVIAELLFKAGILSKEQKKKVFSIK